MLIAGCCQIKDQPKIAIIIPARVDSTRLARKIFINFYGLPMLEHVRRRALMNSYSIPVIVASNDDEVIELVRKNNGEYFKTKLFHMNGISRVKEVSEFLDYTHYIILQGDEILILPGQLDQMISSIIAMPSIDFWNQITSLDNEKDLFDESVVKCILKNSGDVLTIFRKSPLTSDLKSQLENVKKLCGLFAVTKPGLKKFFSRNSSPLQESESIEQLRFIELGYSIRALFSPDTYPSINLNSDVERVRKSFGESAIQASILKEVLSE